MDIKLLPVKPSITFSDLEKLDIRVGRIEKVEDIEKSDKLVRLAVNFGDFKRNILVDVYKRQPKTYKESLYRDIIDMSIKSIRFEQI